MIRSPSRGVSAFVALWALLAFVPTAVAQFDKAAATLYSRAEDGAVQVAIEIDIDEHWHLYHDDLGHPDAVGLPTIVSLTGDDIEWSAVRFPEPHKLDQTDIGGEWIYSHEGTIVLYALGRMGPAATGDDIEAAIEGLTCEDGGSCIPYGEELSSKGPGPDRVFTDFPDDLVVGAERLVVESGSETGSTGASSAADGRTDAEYAAVEFPEFTPRTDTPTHGLGVWLLLAFVAGMILNVMPCVLPVISIKILSFVQQAGEDRKRIFALGVAFAAGIVTVFIVLAALAVRLGLSWGEQFQSQTFLVVMIGIVFAFGLSMFGVYELGVPAGVSKLGGGTVRKEGLVDAFFKGMLATVLATPCSGPFLGSTLTWTLSQPALVVFGIFLSLGLGMALPYVVLTANPALLKLVPRPGPWMDTFKQAMGFVLMATVVYLMISLHQDLLIFTAAFLVFVALGCWWWGRFASLQQSKGRRLATLGVALLLVAGGGHLAFRTMKDAFTGASGHSEWVDFDADRFLAELEAGRSVFVDFTADWCPNCKWNELHVYESDEVQDVLARKGVLAMKADITQNNARTDMIERLMDKLGARSIPFMAVFPAHAATEPEVRFDIVGKDDMLGILDALPEPDVTALR